jgi:phage terminase small subunit
MPNKLTQKQDNFVRFLFMNLPQREAYIKAGYSNKPAVAIVDKNASVLAANSKIVVRLAELRKQADDASIMDVKERKQVLTFLARMKGYKGVAAISELNKMDGAYAPVKSEVKESIEVDVNVRAKVLSLLTHGASRLRESEHNQPTLTTGTTGISVPVAELGKAESVTPSK